MGYNPDGQPGSIEYTAVQPRTIKPSLVGAVVMYAAFAAIILQTYIRITDQASIPQYLALFSAYLILFSLALWKPNHRAVFLSAYLSIQSAIILNLLSLDPEIDVVTGLFALLCYQAAQFFTGRTRWLWLTALVIITITSLIFFYGLVSGLALGMTPAAAGIALAFLVIANQEAAIARSKGEAIVIELEKRHAKLTQYAKQAEQLAALEERNRLARELHDTVSQKIFSISLTTRSTQMLLQDHPERVNDRLEELQSLTNSALADLRGMVEKLRPGTD
jgi:signal transduction histidine kinase